MDERISNYPPGMTAADHAYLDGDIDCEHEEGYTIKGLEEIDVRDGTVSFEVECDVCGVLGYVTYDLVKDKSGNVECQVEL